MMLKMVKLVIVKLIHTRVRTRVSQGRVCSDKLTCCHTETEAADQTFYFTQSQYTDTGPTSPIADPVTPGAWQGSHWSTNFEVTGMTRPGKKPHRKRDSNPGSSALDADTLTTRPTRRSSARRAGGTGISPRLPRSSLPSALLTGDIAATLPGAWPALKSER